MAKDIVIGHYGDGYGVKRMIIGKCIKAEYRLLNRKRDIHYSMIKMLNRLLKNSKTIERMTARRQYYIHPIIPEKCDVIQTYDCVVQSNRKWMVNYENLFPNLDGYRNEKKYTKKVAQLIAKDNCLAIFPFSAWARRYTEEIWRKNLDDDLLEKCLKKVIVLQPPQKVLVNEQEIKQKYDSIKKMEFIFIGNDFWRKGGHDLISVLDVLYNRGYDFHIHVISNLRTVDSVAWNTHISDKEKMRSILQGTEWITWYNNIPNEKVLEIVKQCHVGFLPTYEDTYGFCVLEMQACGVPVVTTDSNALPEFNNSDCGWIIHVEGYQDTRIVDFKNNEKELSDMIRQQLEHIIISIFESGPEELERKAIKSRQMIEKHHSIQEYSDVIYGLIKK